MHTREPSSGLMTAYRNVFSSFIPLILCLLLFHNLSFSQYENLSEATPLGSAELRRQIINCLKGGREDWWNALKTFYGPARDLHLPDMIVFIDAEGKIQSSLIQGEKKVDALSGQQKFWVIVFSQRSFPLKREEGDTTLYSIKIMRETTEFIPGPTTNTLLGMIAIATEGITGKRLNLENTQAVLKDSTAKVKLTFFGDIADSSNSPLYFANVGFTLMSNTYIRINVYPSEERGCRSFHEHFVNTEGTYFSTSVGVSLIGKIKKDSLGTRTSFLILGNLNLLQAKKPIDSRTYGIVAGLAVNNQKFFSQFFIGGRFSVAYLYYGYALIHNIFSQSKYSYDDHDNLFGNLGVVAGVIVGEKFTPNFRIGVDIVL